MTGLLVGAKPDPDSVVALNKQATGAQVATANWFPSTAVDPALR